VNLSTLVVVPTYNERENLQSIVGRTLGVANGVNVLIVDDNSPDGTGKIADRMSLEDGRVFVLHREKKSGIGSAYRAGFEWALSHGYAVVVEMDADGSHRPEQLPRFLEALDSANVVLGSRWIPGGSAPDWSKRRKLLSRAGSLYARVALGLPFGDLTGGYRAYRSGALEELGYAGLRSQGYCFQIEMVFRAANEGLRIVEVPIDFDERETGTSKMSGGIIVEALLRVTWWGLTGLRVRRQRAAKAGRPIAPGEATAPAE
jgi:dolichol-phosphate mannosyltransferase